jgi:hypothetical protein
MLVAVFQELDSWALSLGYICLIRVNRVRGVLGGVMPYFPAYMSKNVKKIVHDSVDESTKAL